MRKVIDYLLEAAAKSKEEVPRRNSFRNIGFDGMNPRLGWVMPPAWSSVEEALQNSQLCLKGKDEFIFVGIGGSINSIKTVLSLNKKVNIHCIDSLDPQAVITVLSKIENLDKTAVIPISKSGTTKETQLIAHTLRELFFGFGLSE